MGKKSTWFPLASLAEALFVRHAISSFGGGVGERFRDETLFWLVTQTLAGGRGGDICVTSQKNFCEGG